MLYSFEDIISYIDSGAVACLSSDRDSGFVAFCNHVWWDVGGLCAGHRCDLVCGVFHDLAAVTAARPMKHTYNLTVLAGPSFG